MFSPYKVFFPLPLSPAAAVSGKGRGWLGAAAASPLPVSASPGTAPARGKPAGSLLPAPPPHTHPRTTARAPQPLSRSASRAGGGAARPRSLPSCPSRSARGWELAASRQLLGVRGLPGGGGVLRAAGLRHLGSPGAPAGSRGAEPPPPGQPDRARHWGAAGEGPLAAGGVCAGKGCNEPCSLGQLHQEPLFYFILFF